MQKIIEHVSEKLCGSENSGTTYPSVASNSEKINPFVQENQASLLESIEILCNDQVNFYNLNLIFHFNV